VSFRSLLIVLLALVLGASAAVGIGTLTVSKGAVPQADTVPVVVAAADVARFTALSPLHLTIADWPKGLVPPGALTTIEEASDRVVLTSLVKGEVLSASKLAGRGTGRGLAPGIERGKRAFTIQTPNVASGVAGFILPGNKVDVLLTASGQASNDSFGGGTTVTLLQNVEILAVDQRVEAPADNKVDTKDLRSVTLLVTPDDAARLDLGQAKGTLHLTLRNPEDTEHVATRRATLKEIGLHEEKPPVKEAAPPPKLVEPPSAPPPPPPPLAIRTLRGTQEGAVLIYPGGAR
jgi:pilus assembly protein CpaB